MTSIRVVAAVVQRDGRYLVCQRPLTKRHGGLWEFPGGKRETNESDEAALVRELEEELAVSVIRTGQPFCELQDPSSPYLVAFIPVEIVGEPVRKEHLALHWLDPIELSRLPMAPTDRRFLEFVVARRARS